MSACRNAPCGAPLQPSWAFCPRCGSATSGVASVSDLTVVVPPDFANREYAIPIEGWGPRPVRVKVDWMDPPEGFEPLPVRSAAGSCVLRFRLRESFELTTKTLLAAVASEDAPRNAAWSLHPERRQAVRVHLLPEAPGQLHCNEEAVVLRGDRPARHLHLRNVGGRTLLMRRLEAPPGVAVSDASGRPLNDLSLPQWSLEAGADTLLSLQLHAAGSGEETLRIDASEGPPLRVALVLPRETHSSGGFQPRFVVGIDVGTENASVYCRDLSDGSVFPVPLDGAATRIPCYMAFDGPGSDEPAAFGKSAVDRLVLGRGIVVRDLKIHLRHGRQACAQQFGDAFRTENLLFHLLSHLKQGVERFLESRAGAVASVHWCFTLPVLSDGAAFDTLRRKYRAILRRVFMREIRDGLIDPEQAFGFLTEPEAAALYVFQRLGVDVPTLLPRPFADGDVVCVVDAGAGTTDVALMRMRIRDGQQTFDILGEIGTDLPNADALHPDDFGGRAADLALVECLARASLRGVGATPENVAKQMGLLLGDGTPDPQAARNRALQAAMEAKHLLCLSGDKIDVRDTAWPDLDQTIPGTITLRRFHVTVQPALERILARIEELVARCGLARRDISWVFAIGGSSNIPIVEERLKQLFPDRVISLEQQREVRMEAVARGAVWSWRAHLGNVSPLDVALQVRRGDDVQRQPVAFRDRPLTARAHEFHFELADEAAIELVGVRDGQSWRLTGITLEAQREPRDVAITVRSADGALYLEAQSSGASRVAPAAWLA